ncbi:GNAT family N-acetyltransferase [Sphaerisporangium sp. TRM90804]|uniref:GNAT family N-acetyltransferase n=1 Tax=Sphaerisporangium sp. TRM90804 TaxID=3031113 RepID=UPI00244BC11B|nr:GNAT family N-acetyltransferase [Sphaerisporangium sp. TRM90804]MDH2427829.1 GNAT family N-acetyltransferase [Sphaerisporangium sp. TRM90804]
MTVLRSGRSTLRPITPEDAVVLHAHWNLPLVRRHLFDDRSVTAEEVADVIAHSSEAFAAHGYGVWAVIDDGTLIGSCGLLPREGGGAELLYSLDPGRWGEGLATEAAAVVMAHARDVLGVEEIIAETDEGNAASARLAERLGMRECEGRVGPGGPLRRFTTAAAHPGNP